LDINSAKSRKIERKCVDLIVLGIPWKSTEEAVRRYFEQYGEVVLCEVNEMKCCCLMMMLLLTFVYFLFVE
jgi:RNA recognition motif-containing protein